MGSLPTEDTDTAMHWNAYNVHSNPGSVLQELLQQMPSSFLSPQASGLLLLCLLCVHVVLIPGDVLAFLKEP